MRTEQIEDTSNDITLYYENGLFGFCDNEIILVEPSYDWVSPFKDGFALIIKDGKYGFIDKYGDIMINPKYDYAQNFLDGLAYVSLNNKYGYIDVQDEIVINIEYDFVSITNNSVVMMKDNLYTYDYINKSIYIELAKEALEFGEIDSENYTKRIRVTEINKLISEINNENTTFSNYIDESEIDTYLKSVKCTLLKDLQILIKENITDYLSQFSNVNEDKLIDIFENNTDFLNSFEYKLIHMIKLIPNNQTEVVEQYKQLKNDVVELIKLSFERKNRSMLFQNLDSIHNYINDKNTFKYFIDVHDLEFFSDDLLYNLMYSDNKDYQEAKEKLYELTINVKL